MITSHSSDFLGYVLFRCYQVLMVILTPFLALFLVLRWLKGKENIKRIFERFGKSSIQRPSKGPLIWVHAASVGESLSTLPLIEALLKKKSDLHILVTTNTRTSAEIMSKRLPNRAFHQFFPLDQVFCIKSFLKKWSPQGVLWLESELWPGFLFELHAKKIPCILVNARLSRRSFQKWQRFSPVVRFLLSQFSLCLAQSSDMAFRLRKLGARTVRMPGNLKFSSPPLPLNPNDFAHLKALISDRPVWCAASTHIGEEELIADVHKQLRTFFPTLLTIIVPRHPERGESIEASLKNQGFMTARRQDRKRLVHKVEIYIADTVGELGLFYRLCPFVFIGGSLVPKGGHNPIEPALLGCALIWGPHMENFQEIANKFLSHNAACQVKNIKELFDKVLHFFQNPMLLLEMEEEARKLAKSEQDVLVSILEDIMPFFPFLEGDSFSLQLIEEQNV
ncbi:MAG: 3-deoxy-D-manno-octulosonic acid transferase [Proteobacteria bacterium]|nr:3-deoxy-D-manno-octulosonic acid transferase [Pseudomonadota bacterium]